VKENGLCRRRARQSGEEGRSGAQTGSGIYAEVNDTGASGSEGLKKNTPEGRGTMLSGVYPNVMCNTAKTLFDLFKIFDGIKIGKMMILCP
jgi:hypothetical protein